MSEQEAIARSKSGPDAQVEIIHPNGPEDALRAVLSGDVTRSFTSERDRMNSSQNEETNLRSIAMRAKRCAKMFVLTKQKDCDAWADLMQAVTLGTSIIRLQRPLADGVKLSIFVEWLELDKEIEQVRAETSELGERLIANIKSMRAPAQAAREEIAVQPKRRSPRPKPKGIVELEDMPPSHSGPDGKGGSA